MKEDDKNDKEDGKKIGRITGEVTRRGEGGGG